MLIGLFKAERPAIVFIMPLLAGLLWLVYFWQVPYSFAIFRMPIYAFLYDVLSALRPYVLYVFAVVLVSAGGMWLNYLVDKNEVLDKPTNLVGMFYILLTVAFPHNVWLSPALICNLLLIWMLSKIFSLYKSPSALPAIFDSAFIISLASFIFLPAAYYFVLLLVAIGMLRPYAWREWTTAFIGFLLPYLFYGVLLFWNDSLRSTITQIASQFGTFTNISIDLINENMVFAFTMGVFLVLSLFRLQAGYYKNVIRTREFQKVILYFLLVTLVVFTMLSRSFEMLLGFCTIPFSILLANYFNTIKKAWLYETLFVVLLSVIIYGYIR